MNLQFSIITKETNLHAGKTYFCFPGASSGPESAQILLSSL